MRSRRSSPLAERPIVRGQALYLHRSIFDIRHSTFDIFFSRAPLPLLVAAALLLVEPRLAVAQHAAGKESSPNVHLLSHLPLGPKFEVSNIELEQELSRPYAYVGRGPLGGVARSGFQVISVKDPAQARVLYSWWMEDPELHQGQAKDVKYAKAGGRYYVVVGFQYRGTGPDGDLGGVVFDVTGLPDTSKVREVARIRLPDLPGGFHNIFTYKHSDGRSLLFATVEAPLSHPYGAHVYDIAKLVAGAPDYGFAGGVPLPEPRGQARGYHDVYVGFDPVSQQDRFYGGGPETTPLGGNYVFDVTRLDQPRLLASIIAEASMQSGGHSFVPGPDGRYALTVMTSPGHQPVRFWDLKPALDGQSPTIRQPVGEWTFDPRKTSHQIEIRWPYVFLSALQGGLYILDMRNPSDPVEVGFYDTYNYRVPYEGGGVATGAWGVDVRNADGLIVASDMITGFWTFKLDGFDGWNGHQWGVPNISGAQDWDNGPDGAAKSTKVS